MTVDASAQSVGRSERTTDGRAQKPENALFTAIVDILKIKLNRGRRGVAVFGDLDVDQALELLANVRKPEESRGLLAAVRLLRADVAGGHPLVEQAVRDELGTEERARIPVELRCGDAGGYSPR